MSTRKLAHAGRLLAFLVLEGAVSWEAVKAVEWAGMPLSQQAFVQIFVSFLLSSDDEAKLAAALRPLRERNDLAETRTGVLLFLKQLRDQVRRLPLPCRCHRHRCLFLLASAIGYFAQSSINGHCDLGPKASSLALTADLPRPATAISTCHGWSFARSPLFGRHCSGDNSCIEARRPPNGTFWRVRNTRANAVRTQ